MKRPRHSKALGFGFAAACLVITWIAAANYWSTHQLVRSFDSVSESHQAIEKLQSVQELMEAAESSVYSYVITGRTDRLNMYWQAKTLIPRKLHDTEKLLSGHTKLTKTLKEFSRLYSVHQQYLSTIVTSRQTQGAAAASQWVATEDQHAIRELLDVLMADVQKDATQVLRQRSASTSEHSSQTTLALVSAAGMSLFLVALFFALLRKETGERHDAENTNYQLETFLRSIVERIPYMVLVKEATNLRITLANKAATEWMGRSEQDLVGSNDYDLRPKEAARLAMEQDRDVLQKGKPVDVPEETLVREGQERIFHTQKVAIYDEMGHPAFLLTISEDITERKQAERTLERSRDTAVQSERLKSEFIRNMSHEIRTPLSIVSGMLTLLLDTSLTPEQCKLTTKAEHAAASLVRLTKDILDFSKIEAGTFTLEMKELHPQPIIEGILTMLSEQAKAKGVRMVSLIPPNIPAIVIGDPIRLRQVLTELIGNALKFTSQGEIIVRVNEAEPTDTQLSLTFKISDTGLGISEEAQKHLFEPFRQGDGSPTRRFGGTGLGLAISKRIVELMGGQIGFTSTLNQGSTFWCTIPFQKRGAQGQAITVASLPWTKARVLVIDENDVSRQQLRSQLSSWALASEGVSSGESALELLRREHKAGRPFPIVLFDMHLSDMEGVAFARAIKTDLALASTYLVVLTETPLDPATAASFGFSTAISKPPKVEMLYDRLAALIESPVKDHKSAA